MYQNEDRIGEVLKRVLEEGIVERKELFVTSKVWNDMHGDGQVLESCRKSLQDLQLSYIDLYFVHWPFLITMRRDVTEIPATRIPDLFQRKNSCLSGDSVNSWWRKDWSDISVCPI